MNYDNMSFEEKCNFWRGWLHQEDNTTLIHEWHDERSFVEECERYKDVLLLDNKTYRDWFITHMDHLDGQYVDFILVVRLECCAE